MNTCGRHAGAECAEIQATVAPDSGPSGAGLCLLKGALRFRRFRNGIALGGLVFAAGCASWKSPPPVEPVFFPAGISEPRLQYLTSYSKAEDVSPRNRWLAFLVGRNPAQRQIVKPYGLAFSSNRLYVCDTVSGSVEILDIARRSFSTFTPKGQGQLRTPINLAVDADGTRYVADPARGAVLIYKADGTCLGSLGEPGQKPTDVLLADDRLYVTDLHRHRIGVYLKQDRQFLYAIPREEEGVEGRLFQPVNLARDTQGGLYVSDAGAFCVKKYDAAGRFLRTFGSHGDSPGQFARPRGVAVDRAGRVFVVDAAAQVVQIFDPEGRLLLFFGTPGESAASLNLPAKVLIDYEHTDLYRRYAAPGFELEYLVLVTNQYGDRKVSVYGFGHKIQTS